MFESGEAAHRPPGWHTGAQRDEEAEFLFCHAQQGVCAPGIVYHRRGYEDRLTRYAELQKGVHQSRYFDPAESNCKPLAAVLDDNNGYLGPVCSR